jgi:hypothetical protein
MNSSKTANSQTHSVSGDGGESVIVFTDIGGCFKTLNEKARNGQFEKNSYKSICYTAIYSILQFIQKAEMNEVKRALPYLSVTCF